MDAAYISIANLFVDAILKQETPQWILFQPKDVENGLGLPWPTTLLQLHIEHSEQSLLASLQLKPITHVFIPAQLITSLLIAEIRHLSPNALIVLILDAHITKAACLAEFDACLYVASELQAANQLQRLLVQAQQMLALSAKAMAGFKLLDHLAVGIFAVSNCTQVLFMNRAAAKMLGCAQPNNVLPCELYDFIDDQAENDSVNSSLQLLKACRSGTELAKFEVIMRSVAGAVIPVECSVSTENTESGGPISLVCFQDISSRKKFEDELKWQVNHDHLTRLLNRTYFNELLSQEIHRLRRSREKSAILFIDLDKFKLINDTCGHAAGDQLLIDIGRKFDARLRACDAIARLGGDEFAVLLRNVDSHNAFELAEQYRNILQDAYFSYNEMIFDITGSIGICMLDSGTSSAKVALANADGACYLAKQTGRNCTHLYNPDSDSSVVFIKDEGWSARIDHALRNNTFVVHFQPVIPLNEIDCALLKTENSTHVAQQWQKLLTQLDECRYEMLLRLPVESELAMPSAFMTIAERFNLLDSIDRWVIHKAINILVASNKIGIIHKLCINLSKQSVIDDSFASWLTASLKHYGIAPSQIIFEINERVVMAELNCARQLMQKLSAIGVKFLLDEFGSGLSSLLQLQNLPIEGVKIDANLIRSLDESPVEQVFLRSINEMVHAMGMYSIATKVERIEQLEFLAAAGTDFIQGFYLVPPLEVLPVVELR